jgi:hypothetical protein
MQVAGPKADECEATGCDVLDYQRQLSSISPAATAAPASAEDDASDDAAFRQVVWGNGGLLSVPSMPASVLYMFADRPISRIHTAGTPSPSNPSSWCWRISGP